MQPLRAMPSEIAAHQPVQHRRDPAPSRLTYKAHRLWLTPVFRSLLQVGLPLSLALAAAGWYVAIPENRAALAQRATEVRRSIETRPEFMVKLMAIDGASPVLADEIRTQLPLEFPISSFDIDLEAMQAKVAALDVVDTVDIRIRPGGVMEVHVTERQPVLVWRRPGTIELIDATGHRVANLVERAARPDLPLVAGDGADTHVTEALALIRAAGPLASRLRGLVRVGERRWDLVLDDGPSILLPETDPVPALDQVLALDQAQDLLARDVTHVDMRNPMRPTLRLSQPAAAELRDIRSLSLE